MKRSLKLVHFLPRNACGNRRIAVTVTLRAVLPASAADKPEPFTSKEGKFTVAFPGPPVEGKEHETAVAGLKVVGRGYTYTDKDFRFFYAVLYADLPPKDVQDAGTGELLDRARDDWAKENRRK